MTYLKIFLDWEEILKPFGDAERGRLFTCALHYARTGEALELSGNERYIWTALKVQIDRDRDEFESFSKKQSENGKKGGRPKTQENPKNPKNPPLFFETQKSQDKDKDKDEEYISSLDRDDDIASIVDAWNSLPDIIPNVTKITNGSTRHKLLAKRIRDYSVDDIIRAIKNIRESDFLQGGNDRGWTITFDWFVKPENFQKVLDGNYASHPKQTKSTRQAQAWESEVSYDLDSAMGKNGYSVPKLKRKE